MIVCYFGLPGCGKTTLLSAIAKRSKGYRYIFSNVRTTNTFYLSDDEVLNLGNFTLPEYSLCLIDEAGVAMNSRSWKSFPKNLIYYLKMSRHYKVDFVFFSQSYNDFDVTIRRLADRFYRVKKFGVFSFVRQIMPMLTISDDDHQIVDGYRYASILSRILNGKIVSCFLKLFRIQTNFFFSFPFYFLFRPFYYRYFNSWDRDDLPEKFSF